MLFEFFKKKICGFFVHKWRSTIFPVCGFFVHNSQIGIKKSPGVIFAIFGHFCKIEKARIGAISWTDIGSAWTPLSIFKNLARWHPVQKKYSRLKFDGNHASYSFKFQLDVFFIVDLQQLIYPGKQTNSLIPLILSTIKIIWRNFEQILFGRIISTSRINKDCIFTTE